MAAVRRWLIASLASTTLVASGAHATSAFASGAWWHLSTAVASEELAAGHKAQIVVNATDLGYKDVQVGGSPVKVIDRVPKGLEVIDNFELTGYNPTVTGDGRAEEAKFACTVSPISEGEGGGELVTCVDKAPVIADEGVEVVIPVTVSAGAAPTLMNEARVEGGEGIPAVSHTQTIDVSGGQTKFGVELHGYELLPENEDGSVDKQAGSHPFQMTTALAFNQTLELNTHHEHAEYEGAAPALVRNLHFVLPRGLLGNVTISPQCSQSNFDTIAEGATNLCPTNTAIGVAKITINEPGHLGGVFTEAVPIFNLVPRAGEPAAFGLEIDKVSVVLDTRVRTGSDYAVEVSSAETSTAVGLLSVLVTFWGSPGDQRHDHVRGWECVGDGRHEKAVKRTCDEQFGEPTPKPFLTMPTVCESKPTTTVTGNSWPHEPGKEVSELGESYTLPSFENCGSLPFEPKIEVSPEKSSANTPSGLTVNVKVPQNTTLAACPQPEGKEVGCAEHDISATKVVLPEGIDANPAAASGLLTCSAESFGLRENTPENDQLDNNQFSDDFGLNNIPCPEQAKIGTVTIKTPLLKNTLKGNVYLASQDTSPFASPLVLYLFAEDPESGVRVKLAGEVQLNQSTGQLTSVFRETPPVPFEELSLSLFGGDQASQTTPPKCSNGYATEAFFTPWSEGATGESKPSFAVGSGAGGGACPGSTLPFGPSLQAGSTNPQAGAYTTFELTIGHADSDQAINGLSVHLPMGIAAKLASVTPCKIEKAKKAECGEESEVGESSASSGLGGHPYTFSGKVYLTEKFDGAPFGLSVVTPANAGPFRLGTLVANSTIQVDPSTAAVTVTAVESFLIDPSGNTKSNLSFGGNSSALPTIVDGVPVQLKQLNVTINRKEFQFNPTNCNATAVNGSPMAVTATLGGSEGASDTTSYPFHAANCGALPFKPTLGASTEGSFSKANGASFVVTVTSGPGQANISKTKLVIPGELPSRLTTIQKACPDATFEKNPSLCDEGSNIGMGTAVTPVLKTPLTGPAYLVSHGGAAFPDVEFVLQGEGITLILDGKTNIHNNVTTSFFEMLPDAPVTSFVANLPRGPHSALGAFPANHATTLCGRNIVVPTTIWGQNGALIEQKTKVAITGCHGVKSFKLSRSQLLAKALKACRTKYKHSRSKRQACERQARRRYGAHASKAKAHHAKGAQAKKGK